MQSLEERHYYILVHVSELLKQGAGMSTPYQTGQLIKAIQVYSNIST
jgi:hypothetical protein